MKPYSRRFELERLALRLRAGAALLESPAVTPSGKERVAQLQEQLAKQWYARTGRNWRNV